MFDNLKEKTNKNQDNRVDDTRMAAQSEHDDVWVTVRDRIKNAELEARTGSDYSQIEVHSPVSDPRIAEQKAGTPLTKAEF